MPFGIQPVGNRREAQPLSTPLGPGVEARLDELAEKCNEGRLTAAEQEQYEAYVEAIDLVSILQAKARRILVEASAA